MDIIGCLPPEISLHILLYLDSEDIEVVSNCIEEWRHLFDNHFWKKVCHRNDYQETEVGQCSDLYNQCTLKHSLHWQAIYTYNRLLESNWSSGNFKCIPITNNIKYDRILYFDDEIIIASLYSKAVNFVCADIINLSMGNVSNKFIIIDCILMPACTIAELQPIFFRFDERNIVKKIVKHQNLLIYFVNRTLKILNMETKSWILALKLEVSKISYNGISIDVSNNLLAVLNPSDVLYIVNFQTKNINFKMLDVLDSCFGENDVVVVLNNDKKIKVFDLHGKLLMNINYGEGLKVDNIMTRGGYVIIYYCKIVGQEFQKVSFCTIKQETKSLQEIRSISMFYQMSCFPNKYTLLFWNHQGTKSSTYKIWKFTTENHYVAFDSDEKELVWAIANNRYLFLYTEDCVLNMWCLKTGKFIKELAKDDMVVYFYESFQVTKKKFAYINSQYRLCVQNYDFIAK